MKRKCKQCGKDLREGVYHVLCSHCMSENKLKYKMNKYQMYKKNEKHYCQSVSCENRIDLETGKMKDYDIKEMKLIKSDINDEKILICENCYNRGKK